MNGIKSNGGVAVVVLDVVHGVNWIAMRITLVFGSDILPEREWTLGMHLDVLQNSYS